MCHYSLWQELELKSMTDNERASEAYEVKAAALCMCSCLRVCRGRFRHQCYMIHSARHLAKRSNLAVYAWFPSNSLLRPSLRSHSLRWTRPLLLLQEGHRVELVLWLNETLNITQINWGRIKPTSNHNSCIFNGHKDLIQIEITKYHWALWQGFKWSQRMSVTSF